MMKRIHCVLSIVVSLLFVSVGVERLVSLGTGESDDNWVIKLVLAVEILFIGAFLLLTECKSPLFKQNISIITKPLAKTILILVFSVFLYIGNPNKRDFYTVVSITGLMFITGKCTAKPQTRSEKEFLIRA